ncbi:hypothetical protein BT96DRAFT_832408, partial [Gymnopus androsaceus JB14]
AGVSVEEVEEMLNNDQSNMVTVQFDPILALGQSKQTLSWIWYVIHCLLLLSMALIIPIGLHVEWCKAHARAHQYQEELKLQVDLCQNISAALRDGLEAYRKEQSGIKAERAQVWEAEWLPIRV